MTIIPEKGKEMLQHLKRTGFTGQSVHTVAGGYLSDIFPQDFADTLRAPIKRLPAALILIKSLRDFLLIMAPIDSRLKLWMVDSTPKGGKLHKANLPINLFSAFERTDYLINLLRPIS